MQSIVLIALAAVAVVSAKHSIPSSCVAEMEAHKTCMENAMGSSKINKDNIKACFEASTVAECQKGGSGEDSSEEVGGATDSRKAFHKCIHDAMSTQMSACLAGKVSFSLEEPQGWGKHGRHGRQAGENQGGWGGKGPGGRFGGKGGFGGKPRGNMVQHLLEKAEKCGVSECVRAEIPQEFIDNPDAAKQAMCNAKAQCPRNENSQCASEMSQLRQAECECRQASTDEERQAAETTCAAETGFTPNANGGRAGRQGKGKGKGRGGDRQMDCSALPDRMPHHGDECA